MPAQGNKPESLRLDDGKWAMDNGAFTKFDAAAYMAMLEAFWPWRAGCLWVTAPDVVGDAEATLARWPFWSRVIHGAGYPAALVAQDGLTVPMVPWAELDCLFIGGSTAWKLGSEARTLAGYAKARGKWLHVGRVNSRRRMRYAASIGADSYDGSSCSWFPDTHIPKRLRWDREIRQQPELGL